MVCLRLVSTMSELVSPEESKDPFDGLFFFGSRKLYSFSRGKKMRTLQECKCCGDEGRVRQRDFSPQAWTFLMHWEEIDSSVVGQPICNSCYDDLRELLIERSYEIERTLAEEIASQKAVVAETLAKRDADTPIAS